MYRFPGWSPHPLRLRYQVWVFAGRNRKARLLETAFKSHQVKYQFFRMPFRLKSTLDVIQRASEVIISSVKWQSTLVCLDDISTILKTVQQYLDLLRQELMLLWGASLADRSKNCSIFAETIVYLREEIRSGRLRITETTKKWNKNTMRPYEKDGG